MPNNNFFPDRIGRYQFISSFSGGNYTGDYHLGLYKGSGGNVYFVKRWVGKNKNLAYKWLKNEANICRELSRHKNKLNIYVPRFVDLVEDNYSLTLFMEYVQGEDLSSTPPDKKALVYERILKYLKSSKFNLELNSRPNIYWLLLTPITTIYSILKFPDSSRIILGGFIQVYRQLFNLIKRDKLVLVHRDLNDHNVIVSHGKVFLIDFELAVYADPLIDTAVLLLKLNESPQLIKELNRIPSIHDLDKQSKDILTSYMTIFALYDLCFDRGLHSASLYHLQGLTHEK